jgi:hypothetical protein
MHLIRVSSKAQFIVISIAIIIGTDHFVLSLEMKSNDNVPDSFDWRTEGVVTPVQDYSESPHVAGVVMVGK